MNSRSRKRQRRRSRSSRKRARSVGQRKSENFDQTNDSESGSESINSNEIENSTSPPSIDRFSDLIFPRDLLIEIFTYFDSPSILRLTSLSRKISQIIHFSPFLHRLFLYYHPIPKHSKFITNDLNHPHSLKLLEISKLFKFSEISLIILYLHVGNPFHIKLNLIVYFVYFII